MRSPLSFLIFFGVALSIVGGVHYYLWLRLVRDPGLSGVWRYLATGGLVFLAVSMPTAMILSRRLSVELAKPLFYVPFVWMGLMLILMTLALGADLTKAALAIGRWVSGSGPLDPDRRLFLSRASAGFILGAGTLLGGFSVWTARRSPQRTRVAVALSRLPAAFNGFRIVQISDLHLGLTIDKAWLEDVVDRVNALEPDLIAITGDLVDGSPEALRDAVSPLARLKAREGVFFVTGNHEYYSGVQGWLKELAGLGVRVLRNERVEIRRDGAAFDLAGVDDYHAHGMAPGHGADLPRALAGLPEGREVILLAHQPRAIQEASELGVGLQLSGHTHGGQIWPWNYLVYLQQPYRAGLFRHGPRTQLYVNQGTGYWGPPLRLGTRGEITEVVLQAA